MGATAPMTFRSMTFPRVFNGDVYRSNSPPSFKKKQYIFDIHMITNKLDVVTMQSKNTPLFLT